MFFPIVVIALDLGHVPFFLHGNDIDTRDRRVGVITLSPPSSAVPGTSLMVLILLRVGGRSLLSGRELFSTRRVSRGGVGGFILSNRVFLFFFSGPIPFGTFRVYVADIRGGLEYCLYLRVDGFFHGLFSEVQVTGSGRRF